MSAWFRARRDAVSIVCMTLAACVLRPAAGVAQPERAEVAPQTQTRRPAEGAPPELSAPSADVGAAPAESESGGVPPAPEPVELAFPSSGYRRHDGFFLRMTFGVGWGTSELDGSGTAERDWFGPGFAASFDLGASLVENLILHLRLRHASVTWPTLTYDGEERPGRTGVLASQVMVGLGIQYYFMPLNLFVGAAAGIAGIEAVVERRDLPDQRYNGGTGLAFDLDLGKEWWVSENWALGVAARLSLARVPAPDETGDSAVFDATFGALLFTATYH
jgi:hypothetical protein